MSKYICFYSDAKEPYNKLSNFHYVKEGILYNGLKYPSVEHAYQASKFNNEKDKLDFTMDGKYGNIDGFKLLYGDDYLNKQKYWMAKENIGILAKLGWQTYPKDHYTYKELDDNEWLNILREKYKIKEYQDLLLSTNDNIIYEFKRGKDKYSAHINDKGELEGSNKLGDWLMKIRNEFKLNLNISNINMSNCIVDKKYILIDGVNDTDDYKLTDFADNDNQFDDIIDDDSKKREELLDYWKSLEQYEQKSMDWLKQRSQYLGGSEAGAVLGVNHYEPQYKIIWKKLETIPFGDFTAVYHGNKYEDVAIMVYEWIFNIKVDEYGFLPHRTIKWMGASPDGITSSFKLDGIHKSNNNGIMIEIKCPTSRKINMNINANDFDIIPEYYYAQIQQQMETCDLNFTDFWQIKVEEYMNKEDFINDTSDYCPFKSKKGEFKGAVIQILPIKEFKGIDLSMPDRKLKQKIYAHAKFLHQPRLNMSFEEIRQWIIDTRNGKYDDIQNENVLKHYKIRDDYCFHCVKWWKVVNGRCKRFKRNKDWINSNMKTYEKIWNYISFFRSHDDEKNMFIQICHIVNDDDKKWRKSFEQLTNENNIMLDVADKLIKGDENDIKDIKRKYFFDENSDSYNDNIIDDDNDFIFIK